MHNDRLQVSLSSVSAPLIITPVPANLRRKLRDEVIVALYVYTHYKIRYNTRIFLKRIIRLIRTEQLWMRSVCLPVIVSFCFTVYRIIAKVISRFHRHLVLWLGLPSQERIPDHCSLPFQLFTAH